MDAKIIIGASATWFAAGADWVNPANDVASLVLTMVGITVGVATLVYTIERIKYLKKKGKDDKVRNNRPPEE